MTDDTVGADETRPVAPLDGAAAEAVRAYHAPGDVPREAMWAAIQARRAATATAAPARADAPAARPVLTVSTGAAATRQVATRSGPPRWAYALAASLLLVVGIGIGRQMRGSLVARENAVADSLSAVATWQAASVEHFGQAEALLTRLTQDPEARREAQLAAWARDLLGSTRLLLDSPAGQDPRRRALLLDLELALVQLVQSAPADAPAADGALDAILTQSSLLLTHLRMTVPAGPAPTVGR
jgi:hypothetical protein